MDPVAEWEKLLRRVRLSYYIGAPAVAAIDAKVRGTAVPTTKTIGIDIDNDGVVDKTLVLEK